MKKKIIAVAALAAVAVQAEFKVDRSAMSEEYWKIWNDDVQKRIDADIEKYRKADGAFALKGVPDGAEVKVEQLTHGFFFGAHIFNFGQLGKTEWNNRYKELYNAEGGLFNSGTVAFYWRTLEMYPYAPRFESHYEDSEEFWNSCPQPKEQPLQRLPAPAPFRTREVRGRGKPFRALFGGGAGHGPCGLLVRVRAHRGHDDPEQRGREGRRFPFRAFGVVGKRAGRAEGAWPRRS